MTFTRSWLAKLCFFTALILFLHLKVAAQTCSPEALTAKYWQYRKTFNEHFLMIDRKPEGCIGNGITSANPMPTITCATGLLHGLSLPATSIIEVKDGGFGMGFRNDTASIFYNPNCANHPDSSISGTSYQGNPAHNSKHNFIEYGVETVHQLGWYLVTLCTEYELLKRNKRYGDAQKTLEEIFLALQAYRRLDITANCLVKKRYDEITADFEVERCTLLLLKPPRVESNLPASAKLFDQICRILTKTTSEIQPVDRFMHEMN